MFHLSVVNILPPRDKEINQRKICTVPPKYTPSIFEEVGLLNAHKKGVGKSNSKTIIYYIHIQVGRALGPSILDLTESNPSSRLRASEFRNLQGLRNALRNDIEKGVLKVEPIQKVII